MRVICIQSSLQSMFSLRYPNSHILLAPITTFIECSGIFIQLHTYRFHPETILKLLLEKPNIKDRADAKDPVVTKGEIRPYRRSLVTGTLIAGRRHRGGKVKLVTTTRPRLDECNLGPTDPFPPCKVTSFHLSGRLTVYSEKEPHDRLDVGPS